MSLQISSIDGQFAFEVRGLELWRPLPDDVVDALETAWSIVMVVSRRLAVPCFGVTMVLVRQAPFEVPRGWPGFPRRWSSPRHRTAPPSSLR